MTMTSHSHGPGSTREMRDIPLEIAHASEPADVESARQLFIEYAQSLGFSLCFQGFEEELATLPGRYDFPSGRILLARIDGWAAGCVAIRELSPGIAEMKRLYVPPHFRGLGIGRALAMSAVDVAMAIGYRSMRLDTTAAMGEARALYASLKFIATEPYNDAPLPDILYMQRVLV